jgi:hypothetical protein
MAKAPKAAIGAAIHVSKSNHKRRSEPKPRRHSKKLGPKNHMKGDRGKH